jgi:hypothetical protein
MTYDPPKTDKLGYQGRWNSGAAPEFGTLGKSILHPPVIAIDIFSTKY